MATFSIRLPIFLVWPQWAPKLWQAALIVLMDEGCRDHQIFGITISLIVQWCINKVIVENLDWAIYCPYTHTKDGKQSYNGHWCCTSRPVQNRGEVHTSNLVPEMAEQVPSSTMGSPVRAYYRWSQLSRLDPSRKPERQPSPPPSMIMWTQRRWWPRGRHRTASGTAIGAEVLQRREVPLQKKLPRTRQIFWRTQAKFSTKSIFLEDGFSKRLSRVANGYVSW
jgi:hypothetical protein